MSPPGLYASDVSPCTITLKQLLSQPVFTCVVIMPVPVKMEPSTPPPVKALPEGVAQVDFIRTLALERSLEAGGPAQYLRQRYKVADDVKDFAAQILQACPRLDTVTYHSGETAWKEKAFLHIVDCGCGLAAEVTSTCKGVLPYVSTAAEIMDEMMGVGFESETSPLQEAALSDPTCLSFWISSKLLMRHVWQQDNSWILSQSCCLLTYIYLPNFPKRLKCVAPHKRGDHFVCSA